MPCVYLRSRSLNATHAKPIQNAKSHHPSIHSGSKDHISHIAQPRLCQLRLPSTPERKLEILTSSILACKNFLASRPAQTFNIEKSPCLNIPPPLCAPSCLRIGSALDRRSISGFRDLPIPSSSRILITTFTKSPSILT